MQKQLCTTPLSKRSTCRQHGLTLIELIAALGIAAVIIVGALSLYNNADNSQKANTIMQDMTAIQQATRALYQGNYVDTVTANNLKTSLQTINRWPKTAVNITLAGNGSTFTLTITNVNTSTCTSIISAATGWLSATGLDGATITALPASGSAASIACALSAGTTTGTMTFTGQ